MKTIMYQRRIDWYLSINALSLSFCSKNRVPFCQLSETDSLSTPIIGDLLPIQPFRT